MLPTKSYKDPNGNDAIVGVPVNPKDYRVHGQLEAVFENGEWGISDEDYNFDEHKISSDAGWFEKSWKTIRNKGTEWGESQTDPTGIGSEFTLEYYDSPTVLSW